MPALVAAKGLRPSLSRPVASPRAEPLAAEADPPALGR